jgi:hypothetical protein
VVDGAGALRPPAAGDRRAAPGTDIDLLGPSRTGRPGSQRSFAAPILNAVSVQPDPPLSQMWFLLYAQVHQADDAGCSTRTRR